MKLPRAKPSVIFRTLAEGGLLFSTEDEVYLSLNLVGSQIWRLLPPACGTLEEIVARLAREYPDVPVETIRQDVLDLLEDLNRHGLLEPAELP